MKIEMRSQGKILSLKKEEMVFLARLLTLVAKKEEVPQKTKITIVFTDDYHIQRLNKKHRNMDKSTDVLSFPMMASKQEIFLLDLPGLEPTSLGDIIISLEHCSEQAKEYNHSFRRELCFLALHGFLHLLGYDHIQEEEAAQMEATAEKYLDFMGVVR